MSNSRIAELYDRYMAGRLSRQEDRELVDLLQDPAAQREWRLTATLEAKLHEDLRDSTEVASARRGIRWPIWAPLAAAAALLVTVGGILFVHRSPAAPEYAMGRLTLTTGPLTIVDADSASARITTVQTPSNSVCRLDQPDGTVIAVAGSSAMRWSQDRTSGAKTLDMTAGQAYLDVASQKQPFQIRFPSGAQAEVLGTRLLVSRTGPLDFVSVLKGNVKIQDGRTAVYVAAGQTASPGIQSGSGLFTLIQGAAMPSVLAWVDRVGVDSMRASREAPGTIATKMSMLGLSLTEIQGGVWRLNRKGDDVVAIQEDPGQRGLALFGHREWIKGKYSCKVRVLKMDQNPQPGMEPGIGLAFAYSSGGGVDMAGAASKLAPMLAINPVLNMQADFEIRAAENTLHVRRMEFWPEGHREDGWHRDDWIRTPRDTQFVKERGPCAMGVSTIGCSAEFFDIRLNDAVSVKTLAAADLRAYLGLLARYDFRDVSGSRVPDLVGATPGMDLTIGRPAAVKRTRGALCVSDAADILLEGDLPSLTGAWRKNGGFAVELIMRPTTLTADREALTKLMRLTTKKGHSWVFDGGKGWRPKDQLHHYVIVFDDRQGKFCQVLYTDGRRLRQTVMIEGQSFNLPEHGKPISLSLSPSRNDGSKTPHPWTGDLVHMAIYDHPVSADEAILLSQAWQREAKNDDIRKPLGMVAQYDFRGLADMIVPDSSGVAPPMDLTIGKPGMVECTASGIRVKGAADIAARGELPKLKQGWAKNKGLTLEVFAHPTAATPKVVNPRKLACIMAGDKSIAWAFDGGVYHDGKILSPEERLGQEGVSPEDRIYHGVYVFDDSSGKFVQHFYQDGHQLPSTRPNDIPWNLHRRPAPLELNLIPSQNTASMTQDPWLGELVFMAVYDRPLQSNDVARLQEAGLPSSGQAGVARGELLPWVADFYKRHDQWVLQREKFTDGESYATLSPADIKLSIVEGNGQVKLGRQLLKNGKEGDVLEIENRDQAYCVTELRVPGGLPDAFAVELDLLPVQSFPAPGNSAAASPFLYEGGYEKADRRSNIVNIPGLPKVSDDKESKGMVKSSGLTLTRWGQYRAEYFRVGRLETGEVLYELRLPQSTGPGIRMTWKRDDTIPMSFSGVKVRLGEVRIRRLVPPANLELGSVVVPGK